MPTTKTRINVTVPADVEKVLLRVAERDAMPPATKAAHLIRLALEIEEDEAWDALARKRDGARAHLIPHRRAWK